VSASVSAIVSDRRRSAARRRLREHPGGGHPVLFSFDPVVEFGRMSDSGGYPKGFLKWAYKTMGVTHPSEVLHMCSGSVRVGITVDIRPEMRPRIVADCRSIPLPDSCVDWIMADPPYSKDYAESLYGTGKDFPGPVQIAREAARLLKPGGLFGILCFQVLRAPRPLKTVGVWGVTTGAGYNIRAWSVYRKGETGHPNQTNLDTPGGKERGAT